MAKITEYPRATKFDANDVLLKDGTNGTKTITIEDFVEAVSDITNGTEGKLAKAESIEDLEDAITERSSNLSEEVWESGYILPSGAIGNSSTSLYSKNFNICKPNTTYYAVQPSTYVNSLMLCWYDSSYTIIERTAAKNTTAVSPANASYFKVSLFGYGSTYKHDIAVFEGSTAKEYVPYAIAYDYTARKAANLGQNYPFIDVEMISNNGNEYMYYYMPTDSGKWLRYKFNHHVSANLHADGWVQREVDLVSIDKTTVEMPVVTTGEWEMAVMIQNAKDFIGCQNHGGEYTTILNMYFDGIRKDFSAGAKYRCSEIKVTEKSTMYHPGTKANPDYQTVVGYHYKEYTIKSGEIKISQRVEWIGDYTLNKSYVAMMPAVRGNDNVSAKQVTDHAYDGYNFVESDVSTSTYDPSTIRNEIYRGNEFNLYGAQSGVYIKMTCDIKNRLSSSMAFMLPGDPNSINYNKWYCAYCGNDTAVHSGDVWEWVSGYTIRYGGT